MKKKQLITILVMLVVVAGLAAGYVIVKNNNARKMAEEAAKEAAENATIPIYEIDTEAVEKISYKNEVADITMVRDGDIWIEEEKDVPMNMEYVQNMLDAVSSTVAIKVIREETEDLAEFGLDKPVIEYTITLSDGTEHSVKLGDALVTETEGFYAQFGEDNTVYSVSSNYYVPFTHSYVEMIDIVDEVNITADYVTNVSITSKSDINFEAKYIGDESDSDEYYTWEIVKPYKYIYADTDVWIPQLQTICSITYENCMEYGAEDLNKYGLEEPFATISLDYYTVTGIDTESAEGDADVSEDDAQSTPVPEEDREYMNFTLNIGDMVTEGDMSYFFVQPEDSNNVYLLTAQKVSEMLDFSPYSMADPCIYSVLVDQLSGYEVEYSGKKYVVERKQEGEESVYYVNGKKVDTEELLTLYSAAYLLTLSGEADSSKADDSASPVLTITYHPNDGEDVVVKYLPYDGDNFYQVDKNGMKYFLTDKRGIDDIISRYEAFMSDNDL